MAALLPFGVYLATLAPSITWRNGGVDSADVATAAAVLGIAHPPGYPLFVLAGHLATRTLAWLEPAAAVGVLCAALAAGAAAIVYWTAREAVESRPARDPDRSSDAAASLAALAAGIALALGPVWWSRANLVSAHAANLLFAALLCLIVLRSARRATPALLVIGAAIGGLAASHHLTLLAIPAAAGVACAVERPPSLLSKPRIGRGWGIAAAAALLVGLSPWLLLVAIARTDPAHVWGDPTSLGGLLEMVVGGHYRDLISLEIGSASRRFLYGVGVIASQLGPVGGLLAVLGIAAFWSSFRWYVAFVAALTAVLLAFFAVYPARDVEAYLLPACVAAGPAIARGALRLVDGRGATRAVWGSALLVSAAVVLGLALNWSRMDLSRDREAIDFAQAILRSAPARAVIVTDADAHTFALWYARIALEVRPDTTVVDRSMLAWPWYRAHLSRDTSLNLPADHASSVGDWLSAEAVGGRPLVLVPPR